MGCYAYSENCANPRKPRRKLPAIIIRRDRTQLQDEDVARAADVAVATNLARHLVNTPADRLTTQTYADAIVDLFGSLADVSVDVWEGDRLNKERMGLLQAVGRGAEFGPRLVRISYRPGAGKGVKPVAFVGKGITFDTGGLDIKPSSAMRWMKKDMGGSASVVGLAYWAAVAKSPQPCDFYLALAEKFGFEPLVSVRAISSPLATASRSRFITPMPRVVWFWPTRSTSRSRKMRSHQPVINLATLTGAIKVALGADIAGLFCNSDDLADRLMDCAQEQGDLAWRMPLYAPYKSMLRSNFSDMLNASDGFCGSDHGGDFLAAVRRASSLGASRYLRVERRRGWRLVRAWWQRSKRSVAHRILAPDAGRIMPKTALEISSALAIPYAEF